MGFYCTYALSCMITVCRLNSNNRAYIYTIVVKSVCNILKREQ